MTDYQNARERLLQETMKEFQYSREEAIAFLEKVSPELLTEPSLRWTTEKPTRVGWYWTRRTFPDREGFDHVVQVVSSGGELFVAETGVDNWEILDEFDGVQWAGPIERPK